MKKTLLKTLLSVFFSVFLFTNVNALGTQLFNFAWSTETGMSDPYTTAAMGTENVTLTFGGLATTAPAARSKFGYTTALKVKSIIISEVSSLGQLYFALQNGSGTGTPRILKLFTSLDGGSTWTLAEVRQIDGNESIEWYPANVISKSAVRVKAEFYKVDGVSLDYCWFYGAKAYAHDDAANAANPPTFLSISPAENANLPASGTLTLQFDELVKVGTGTVTLGNATISSVQYLGNKVVVNYTGYTNATNPLTIPAASVTDYAATALTADIVKTYAIDITPPVYQSVVPANASTIHINDLGLDANKIKLTFDEDIQLGTGTITFNTTGVVSASVSGKVLTIGFSYLPYNATNTLTVPASLIQDLSGNNMIGDVVLSYTTGARDATAPLLTAQSVANLATGQPVGGSISFTFNEIVLPTTTPVTINGVPAYISNNGNVIGLNYTNLPYESSIVVNFPAGCLTDTCGNAFGGTVLSFDTGAKTAKAFDYVVAKDGSGNFTTIQAAINAASGTRTFIYVKPGIYSEKLLVNKTNISLIGEDMDKVIITWNECSSTSTLQAGSGISNTGTDASYSMLIAANGFYGENFTVRNDYDYINGTDLAKQQVALEHINADKSVLKNIKMVSYQDTYYPKSGSLRQYLSNCYIQGGTDFIFGAGTCFIDSTTIKCVKGGSYITAAADTPKEFGIVLKGCDISYADTLGFGTANLFYLGRPWKVPAKTSYIDCWFENNFLQAAGWSQWSPTDNHLYAVYNEYNSMVTSVGPMNVASRVAWSKQLTAQQASRYNPDNAFNFGANNTWNPIPVVTAPSAPNITSVSAAGNITWLPVDFAVGYLVYQNDTLLATTTNINYTATCIPTDSFEVVAYNEYGALSARSASVLTGVRQATVKSGFLISTLVSNEIELKTPSKFSTVEVIGLSGSTLISKQVNGSSINIAGLPAGCYLVNGTAKNGEIYVDKIIKR